MSKENAIKKERFYLDFLLFVFAIFSYVAILIYHYHYNRIDFDFYYYYDAVNAFWNGENPFERFGFIYLNYFCVLYAFLLFPVWLGLLIKTFITALIGLAFLKAYRKDKNDKNLRYWIIANIFLIYFEFIQQNVNILVPIVFLLFYKFRDDRPYVSLLFILTFYKINTILIFAALIALDILFKREWKKIITECLYLIPVIIIVIISYVSSVNSGYLDSMGSTLGGSLNIISLMYYFQPQHLFMYSFLIYVFIDKYKKFEVSLIKKFWITFGVLNAIYFLIWIIYLLFIR